MSVNYTVSRYFIDFTTSEDGVFNDLPFTVFTTKDQDKKENMFKALKIDVHQKPYFPHFIFYVCLAIIKRNTFIETSDEKQNDDFVQYMTYIKRHYNDLLKTALSPPYDATPQFPRLYSNVGSGVKSKFMPAKRPRIKIPVSFGLGAQDGPEDDTQSFVEEFFSNFLNDLNFYLQRATGMRKAMLKYL